jgi:hypothetical protein
MDPTPRTVVSHSTLGHLEVNIMFVVPHLSTSTSHGCAGFAKKIFALKQNEAKRDLFHMRFACSRKKNKFCFASFRFEFSKIRGINFASDRSEINTACFRTSFRFRFLISLQSETK